MKACGKLPSRRGALRVVLLGVEADVVRDREQPLEQRERVVGPARERERLDHPEAARQEHALALADPVDRRRAVGT